MAHLHDGAKGGVRGPLEHCERVGGEVEVGIEGKDVVPTPHCLPHEPPTLEEEHVGMGLAHLRRREKG